MSGIADPDRKALAQAKLEMIDAAKAVDPLSLMRRRPWVSVGVAAGVGAVLGMSEAQSLSPATLIRTFSALARTAIFILTMARTSSPDGSSCAGRTHEA